MLDELKGIIKTISDSYDKNKIKTSVKEINEKIEIEKVILEIDQKEKQKKETLKKLQDNKNDTTTKSNNNNKDKSSSSSINNNNNNLNISIDNDDTSVFDKRWIQQEKDRKILQKQKEINKNLKHEQTEKDLIKNIKEMFKRYRALYKVLTLEQLKDSYLCDVLVYK